MGLAARPSIFKLLARSSLVFALSACGASGLVPTATGPQYNPGADPQFGKYLKEQSDACKMTRNVLTEGSGPLAATRTRDQDGLGICGSEMMSRLLQTALPGNPEISPLYLASLLPEDNVTAEEGGELWFEGFHAPTRHSVLDLYRQHGVCKSEDVWIESQSIDRGELRKVFSQAVKGYQERLKTLSPDAKARSQDELLRFLSQSPEQCEQLQTQEFKTQLTNFAMIARVKLDEERALLSSSRPDAREKQRLWMEREENLRKLGELRRSEDGNWEFALNPKLLDFTRPGYLSTLAIHPTTKDQRLAFSADFIRALGLTPQFLHDLREYSLIPYSVLSGHATLARVQERFSLPKDWIPRLRDRSIMLPELICAGNLKYLRWDTALANSCPRDDQSPMPDSLEILIKSMDYLNLQPEALSRMARENPENLRTYFQRILGADCENKTLTIPPSVRISAFAKSDSNGWLNADLIPKDFLLNRTSLPNLLTETRKQIDQGLATGFSLCFLPLRAQDKDCQGNEGIHGLTIVGYEKIEAKKTGITCSSKYRYLLLDSHGASCEPLVEPYRSNCDPKTGHIWMSEEQIEKLGIAFTFIHR